MIKAVIFDLDDTLYEEKQFVMSGFKAVAEYISKKNNLGYDAVFAILKKDFEEGLKKKNFNVLLQKLNLTEEELDSLVKVYREHSPVISLFSDAKKALADLKGKFKLGLITDGYITTQKNKISSLGIENYFDAIIINDMAKGISKADEKPFLDILSDLGMNAENVLFVGDNPSKDFISAKNLGIHTVRVERKGVQYTYVRVSPDFKADYTISTLADLSCIIRKCKFVVIGDQRG